MERRTGNCEDFPLAGCVSQHAMVNSAFGGAHSPRIFTTDGELPENGRSESRSRGNSLGIPEKTVNLKSVYRLV